MDIPKRQYVWVRNSRNTQMCKLPKRTYKYNKFNGSLECGLQLVGSKQ